MAKSFNPYHYERAQDTFDERVRKNAFRCQRCDMLKPLPWKIQDGFRLCRRCTDTLSPLEAQLLAARDRSTAAANPMTTLEFGPTSAFDSSPSVTGIAPTKLNLTRGGASGTIVLTGVDFTVADTVIASDAVHITVVVVLNSAAQITLTISAAGATPRGNYDLIFDGSTLTPRGILSVR